MGVLYLPSDTKMNAIDKVHGRKEKFSVQRDASAKVVAEGKACSVMCQSCTLGFKRTLSWAYEITSCVQLSVHFCLSALCCKFVSGFLF